MNKAAKILVSIISMLDIAILLVLLFLNLSVYPSVDFYTYSEHTVLVGRNPLFSIGKVALFSIAGFLLLALIRWKRSNDNPGISKKGLRLVRLFCGIVILILGIVWIVVYPYRPTADQETVWNSAVELSQGIRNLSATGYLQVYPHQRYMVCMLTPFAWLNANPKFSLYPANLLAILVIYWGLSELAFRLSDDRTAGVFAAIGWILFSPLILYTCYAYGMILSIACMVLSFLCLIRFLENRKMIDAVLIILLGALAVLFYASIIIALIAGTLTLVLSLMRKKLPARSIWIRTLLTACAMFLTLLVVQKVMTRFFYTATDVPESEGLPTTSWILMGISSDDSVAGPGSYDGHFKDIYTQHGSDTEQTAAYEKDEIIRIAREYRNGERSRIFFRTKTEYQWCDPWFGAAVMTIYLWDGSADVPEWLLRILTSRKWMGIVQETLLVFKDFIYLFALIYVVVSQVKRFRRGMEKDDLFLTLLELYFLGGFLFQFFWESKSRYCLPYYLCLIPMAWNGHLVCERKLTELFGGRHRH